MIIYHDILLDATGDLEIRSGDFVVGDSLDQEVATILLLNQGQLKSDPVLGPNLIRMMNSPNVSAIVPAIELHLKRDRKEVRSISVENGEIKISAVQL